MGSSRNSNGGAVSSSVAIDTRLRWPPESWVPIRLSRRSPELELLGDRLHPDEALLGGGVRREPELGGVAQAPA